MDYNSDLILKHIDQYLHDHYCIICEEDFEEILINDLKYMLGVDPDNIYWEDITEPLMDGLYLYYVYFMPRRSFDTTFIYNSKSIPEINLQIENIMHKSQTIQKTEEWHQMRHNMLTASTIYKIFDSICVQNELIYEKCKPYVNSKNMHATNMSSSLNWGNKYEPVSIMIYEEIFSTKINSVGCIQHEFYKCLGASPDGINVDPTSTRHGRLLEIKNVKSRDIDGIVSKPYWVQTQLQMEVCNLNECDFLETKFIEYENYNAFVKDVNLSEGLEPETETYPSDLDDDQFECEYKYKGVILYFYKSSEPPCYVCNPLHIKTLIDIQEWEEQITTEYVNNGYQWITNYYWKLVIFNCVLILRNCFWFNQSIKDIIQFWKLIQEERITGYDHRAPKHRTPKITSI